jgi:DNA polymerase-1
LDERSHSHGLKRVSRIYLGSEDWEKGIDQYLPHKKTSTYELIPTEVRYDYLKKDSAYTFQLDELLEREVKDNSYVYWNILMPATRMFIEIEKEGLRINQHKILEMYQYIEEETELLERELWEIADHVFNPASPQQTAEILYDKLGIPVSPKYGRSTNKFLLEQYRDDYTFVDKLIQFREMRHDLNAYVKGFVSRIDHNFRIHPVMKLFGTVTGRLASEDPSIMNIKSNSRIKELFLPGNGRYIANIDFGQMELRWYYMYSRDPVIHKILTEGWSTDDIKLQEILDTLREKDKKDPHFIVGLVAFRDAIAAKEKRVITKSMVFGRAYGRGKQSFLEGGQRTRRGVTEVGVNREDVDHLVFVIDSMFPGLTAYARARASEARNQGYVESYFGRQRRFPLVTRENGHIVDRQARNMPIQSAGSDLNILCMLHLWDVREKYDIKPMFCVHDSIVLDIPSPDILPALKQEIEDKAYEIVKGEIPFLVDADWGYDWSMQKEVPIV